MLTPYLNRLAISFQDLTSPERDLLVFLQRFKNHPGQTFLALFILAFGTNLLFVALKGWPLPSLHDEFSYLLAADTFASGRLSNPPHPYSAHFETFQVLQQPTYASKYVPMPGLFLALGQCLGHPALGLYLVIAAATALSYWALVPILPHLWALFGAAVIWLQLAPYTAYATSYMSGAVGVMGSGMVLGAGLRFIAKNDLRKSTAVFLALGVFLLASSRPYEGLIVCLAIFCLLATHFWFMPRPLKISCFFQFILPGSTVLLAGASFLLFYNFSVTGNPLALPYSIYEQSHSRTPLFLWSEPKIEKVLPPPNFEEYERDFVSKNFQAEKNKSFLQRLTERTKAILISFSPLWPLGAILLLFSCFCKRSWVWLAWTFFFIFMIACSVTTWFYRHYIGGLLPFLAILWTFGGMNLCRWQSTHFSSGRQVFRGGIWFAFTLVLGLFYLAPVSGDRAGFFAKQRHQMEQQLLQSEGPDLVLVRQGENSDLHEEWVYNLSDPDGAEIVWAHALEKSANEDLIRYFSNRRVWFLEINRDKVQLKEVLISPSHEF